jgi:hypothetical protein
MKTPEETFEEILREMPEEVKRIDDKVKKEFTKEIKKKQEEEKHENPDDWFVMRPMSAPTGQIFILKGKEDRKETIVKWLFLLLGFVGVGILVYIIILVSELCDRTLFPVG